MIGDAPDDFEPLDVSHRLDPDDNVGNALCDALVEAPDPSLIRVLNWHGDWAESAPNWVDFLRTVETVDDVAAKFTTGCDKGVAILVRSTPVVGQYERVRIDGGTTDSNVATVSGTAIEDLVDNYGPPRLVPSGDVRNHFADGDAR